MFFRKLRFKFVSCTCLMICLLICNNTAFSENKRPSEFDSPTIEIDYKPKKGAKKTNEIYVKIVDVADPKHVVMYFRNRGSTGEFRQTLLVKENTPLMYKATLEKESVTSKKIELYIEVVDIRGNRSQYPLSENPVEMVLHYYKKNYAYWLIGAALVGLAITASSNSDSSDTPTLTITAPIPQ